MGLIIAALAGFLAGWVGYSATYDWKYAWVGKSAFVFYVGAFIFSITLGDYFFHFFFPEAFDDPNHGTLLGLLVSVSDITYFTEHAPQALVNGCLFSIAGLPFGCMIGSMRNNFVRLKAL